MMTKNCWVCDHKHILTPLKIPNRGLHVKRVEPISTLYFMLPMSEKYAHSQLPWFSWDIMISQPAGVIQLCIWACEKAIYYISIQFVLACPSFIASREWTWSYYLCTSQLSCLNTTFAVFSSIHNYTSSLPLSHLMWNFLPVLILWSFKSLLQCQVFQKPYLC